MSGFPDTRRYKQKGQNNYEILTKLRNVPPVQNALERY
jgi:hypothetical protein